MSTATRSWWQRQKTADDAFDGKPSTLTVIASAFSFKSKRLPDVSPSSTIRAHAAHTISSTSSVVRPISHQSIFNDEVDPFASSKSFSLHSSTPSVTSPGSLPRKQAPPTRMTRAVSDAAVSHSSTLGRNTFLKASRKDSRDQIRSDLPRASRKPSPASPKPPSRTPSAPAPLSTNQHPTAYRPSQLKVEAITTGQDTDTSSEAGGAIDFGYDDMAEEEDEFRALHRSVEGLSFTPDLLQPMKSEVPQKPASSRNGIISGRSFDWASGNSDVTLKLTEPNDYDRSISPFTIPSSLPTTPLITEFLPKTLLNESFPDDPPITTSLILEPSPPIHATLSDDDDNDELVGYFLHSQFPPAPPAHAPHSWKPAPTVQVPVQTCDIAGQASPASPVVFSRERSPSAPIFRNTHLTSPLTDPNPVSVLPRISSTEELPGQPKQTPDCPIMKRLHPITRSKSNRSRSPPALSARSESWSLDISRLDVPVKSPKKQRSFQYNPPALPPLPPAGLPLRQWSSSNALPNTSLSNDPVLVSPTAGSSTFALPSSPSSTSSPPNSIDLHQPFPRSALKTTTVSVGSPTALPSPKKRGFFGQRQEGKRLDTTGSATGIDPNKYAPSKRRQRPETAQSDSGRSRGDTVSSRHQPLAVSVSVTVSAQPDPDDTKSVTSFGEELLQEKSIDWVDTDVAATKRSMTDSFWDDPYLDSSMSSSWHQVEVIKHIVPPADLMKMGNDDLPSTGRVRSGSTPSTCSGSDSNHPVSPTLADAPEPHSQRRDHTSAPPPHRLPSRSMSLLSKASSAPSVPQSRRPSTSSHPSPLSSNYPSSNSSSSPMNVMLKGGIQRSLPPPPRSRIPSLRNAMEQRQRSGTVSTTGSASSAVTLGTALSPPSRHRYLSQTIASSPPPIPSRDTPAHRALVNFSRERARLKRQPSFLDIEDEEHEDNVSREAATDVDPRLSGVSSARSSGIDFRRSAFGIQGNSLGTPTISPSNQQPERQPPYSRSRPSTESSFLDLGKDSLDTPRRDLKTQVVVL